MKKMLTQRNIATFILGLIWLMLTMLAMPRFIGSGLLLTCYSLLFLVMVLDSLWRPVGMGYFCLVSFLTLGFWVKLVLHLWLDYDFLEPIGLFDSSAGQWNQVLLVTISGVFGVLLAKQLIVKGLKQDEAPIDCPPLPAWYSKWRLAVWLLTAVAIYLIPYSNDHLGIAQSLLIPTLILPWPLNGLFAWILSFGLIAWILVLAGWEYRRQRSWLPALVAVLSEAFFSSVSLLSRASYIFHTFPYMWYLVIRHITGKWKVLIISMILIIWVLLFAITLQSVMVARYFPVKALEVPAVTDVYPAGLGSTPITTARNTLFEPLKRLVADRWIGLEGLMAVVGYPEKGFSLLSFAASERRTSGKLDFFTAEIAKISLSEDLLSRTQYASIPGAFAFFYYTGSLVVVLLGLAALTSVLLVSERFVLGLTQNPYLTGFWSMTLAQTVASFGLGLIQTATFYLVCMAFMILVWLLQGRQGVNRVKNT